MGLGRGKLIEDVLNVQCFEPGLRTTAVTLYNGNGVATTGNGIDTRDCDEIVFIINAGLVNANLEADVVHSNTDNPATATLVAGQGSPNDIADNSNFNAITVANDRQLHQGSIKCKNFNRYMWLRTYQTAITANYSATAHLGRCDRDPQANNPVFDLNE